MDKKSGSSNSADGLSNEIAQSRELVTSNLRGLRYELDFPRRIRRSIRHEPLPWIATAAAVGIFIVLITTRRKKIYVPTKSAGKPRSNLLAMGFTLGALKLVAGLLQPILVDIVEKKVRRYTTSSR